MPDDIRISDLSPVSAITNGALMELSNEDSGAETGYVSVKMTITQLATKLNVSMQYLTDLLTTNKTIAGAINEINDKLKIGTSAPTSLMGNDGDFYLQYTEGTGGADDEVDAFYVKLDGVWCQISTGGGGGSSLGFTDIPGTLTAGSTSVTISDALIETSSVINVYTEGGVGYKTISVSTGSVTLTFDAQVGDLDIIIRVWEVPPTAEGSSF